MGAVTFSLDIRLIECLKGVLPLSVFVETGTFNGDTVEDLLQHFDKIVTIEFSETLWEKAVTRFKREDNVEVLLGDSSEVLAEIRSALGVMPTLFWLDAHWCVADNTAGLQSQCPLLEEIQGIYTLNNNSVILIDDARLFLAPPLAPHEISHWPSFNEIVASLRKLNDQHELMVVNDVIAFYPARARTAMESYAQSFGIDWLVAVNCLKQNGSFMQQLEAKENEIQQKEIEIQQKEIAIQELEAALKSRSDMVRLISFLDNVPVSREVMYVIRRLFEILSPRLGNLNQYVPRPLSQVSRGKTPPVSQTHPTISIVTPSYQQAAFIERTLKSVLAQTYPSLEYVVQDGGSTDGTPDILALYSHQLHSWRSERDSGQSQALNLGFANTSGEIMAWLNSDDLLLPYALATVADFFSNHPEVDVVYGNRLLIDENDMEIGRWVMPWHDSEILSWVDYVPQETLFWRRRIWDKAGGQIDESFRFAMDWDLLVRFRAAGATFAHIPSFLGAFRIHKHQKTSTAMNEIGHHEMDRIRERVLGRLPSRKEIQKATFPFLLRHVAVDMGYRIKIRLLGRL